DPIRRRGPPTAPDRPTPPRPSQTRNAMKLGSSHTSSERDVRTSGARRRGGLTAAEVLDFLCGALAGVAVALLHDADEPLDVSIDLVEDVIPELAPPSFDGPVHLMPSALPPVFVHVTS